MAMEETTYTVGSIVWVKVTGGKWWPGEVVAADTCPEEVTKGLKKDPLAIVKYFDEDYYELVKSHGHIQPFACSKRKDFIKKGRELLKQDPNLDKFDKDVAEAERLCGTHDLFSLEDRDMSPLGSHGDFPRPEHNHGSALVSSSVLPPAKPSASSVHVESQLDAIESRTNSSVVDTFSTPKDVRIRTQELSSSLPYSGSSFGPYSCDVCGFQTSRIANIIMHHKSHTDLHLHSWPSIHTSPKAQPKKTKANTDGKLVRQKATGSSALQKIKRKLLDSGEKPKRKKASVAKKEEGKSFNTSLQTSDIVMPTKAKVTEEKDLKKKTKKKEDDSDAVFEKIKKLGMKRMNRKRGRSYMSMGPSTSPLKTFKRDDISDESSDEGEFLIMREDINSKEEEQDEEGKFALEDEGDKNDETMEDKEEIVTLNDKQLAENKSAAKLMEDAMEEPSAQAESVQIDQCPKSDDASMCVEEADGPKSEMAPTELIIDEQSECDVKGEVCAEEVVDDSDTAEVPLAVNGDQNMVPNVVRENGLTLKQQNEFGDSHDEDLLEIPLPSRDVSINYDVANTDHSYDSSKMPETNNVETCSNTFIDDHVEPMEVSDVPTLPRRQELPPLPPPLPPTPPPPPPPPSPPANDYTTNANIDPGDIPLPPSKTPEPTGTAIKQEQSSVVVQEEPPLEYTKLETLIQPPDMAIPSDDVYNEVDEGPTEIPMVEGNEIIQIGNEQVIDTSMDVFCNEIVIESDDKAGEGVMEYEDICLMAEDKAKLSENNSVSCDGGTNQQTVAENGLVQPGPAIPLKELELTS